MLSLAPAWVYLDRRAAEAIVESLPAAKQGVASAMNDVSRELGGAVGIALIGSALTVGYRSSVDHQSAGLDPALVEATRNSAAGGLEKAELAGSSLLRYWM